MIAWLTKLFHQKVITMSFTAAKATLAVGETIQTVASFAASYVSDTPSVLTVDSTGLVTAVADGTAIVTATYTSDATKSETLTFTVADATPLAALVPATAPVAAVTPVASSTAVTEFEKLEELIETYAIDTVDGVRAAIKFIRSIA